MSLDIIGTLYRQEVHGNDEVVFTPLDGYHVNSTYNIEGLEKWIVTPNSPSQIFFGVKTYFYCFENEKEANELLGLNIDEE